MSIRVAPPHKISLLTVAVILTFLSTSSLATDYQLIEFPDLTDWTVEGSVAEGLKAEKHKSVKGWGYSEYQPFVSSFERTDNSVIYADDSAIFKGNSKNIFYAKPNVKNLTFDINDTILRFIDYSNRSPSAPATWPVMINLEQNSEMNFLGTEESSLELKGHGMRMIYVSRNADLNINVGALWLQFGTDVENPNYLIQIASGGSAEINSNKDMVILADAELTGLISYVVLSNGNLSLDAQRIFVGVENSDHSLNLSNKNNLLDLSSGTASIGSEETELIALSNGVRSINFGANLEHVSLKTKALQIIGDGYGGSEGIHIETSALTPGSFYAKEAYIGNVSKGIVSNVGNTEATLKFDKLWNMATTTSLNVLGASLILDVNEEAYLDKAVLVKDKGSLTLNGGKFVANESIFLNKANLYGEVAFLTAKQLIATNSSTADIQAKSFVVGSVGSNPIVSTSGSTVNLNSSKSADAVIQITGDMVVGDRGTINANFTNADSFFVGTAINSAGNTRTGADGSMKLAFENAAYWRTTGANTQAVDLILNGGKVYLDQTSDGQSSALTKDNAVELTLATLSGEGGVFSMRTSVQEAFGDSIKIGNGSGKHQLLLASTGIEPTTEALERALVT